MQKAIAAGAVIERRYQIQKKIADNTCNCCYLAEDASNSNRLVVLSFPRIELLILPGFASAFKDACDNLANARIGGLVKVLGSGLYESQPYAVLPNITHESLGTVFHRNVSAKQKIEIESVLDWAAPLAVSLDELHDADYIHSNIRPESIYVGPQKLLLGDFITEFALQRMGKFKSAISTLDVSDHLAPEYLKSYYTPSYDQYLLATLVYEALAKQPPFAKARGGDEYRMHVATKIAEPLSNFRPDLVGVSDVLAKALDRNPSNRFTSCRELISQLQEAQVAEPSISPKVVALKPALKEVPTSVVDVVPAEPIITSIRKEDGSGKGKKGLMWLSILLLGTAAVAYTVISQNGADQITSNTTRAKSASGDTAVPVKVVEATKVVQATLPESSKSVTKVLEPSAGSTEGDQALGSAISNQSEKITATDSGQLKSLIEKEALLAHQALAEPDATPTEKTVVNILQTAETNPAKASVVKDFSGLTSVINQAVSAGQKDFLESKKSEADSAPVVSETDSSINVVAITDQVAAANDEVVTAGDVKPVVDSPSIEVDEASEDKLKAQESLNQELLAAQALVNSREAAARAATRKAAAERETAEANNAAEKTSESLGNGEKAKQQEAQAGVEQSSSVIAVGQQAQSVQVEESVDSSQSPVIGSNTSTQQAQLSERQRILAFKKKELARIKGITNDCTVGGKTHREAAAGNLSFVKACMAVGVDPNLAQSNGWTLLHIAARSGHLNMCKLLLAKGAKVNAKSLNGHTALDMAIAQRKTKVITYLKTRGGVATR